MVMSFAGFGSESDCAGEAQQQLCQYITERTPTARNLQLSGQWKEKKKKSGHGPQVGTRRQDGLADWSSVAT
jgi:hypothetical protein